MGKNTQINFRERSRIATASLVPVKITGLEPRSFEVGDDVFIAPTTGPGLMHQLMLHLESEIKNPEREKFLRKHRLID